MQRLYLFSAMVKAGKAASEKDDLFLASHVRQQVIKIHIGYKTAKRKHMRYKNVFCDLKAADITFSLRSLNCPIRPDPFIIHKHNNLLHDAIIPPLYIHAN